MVDRSSHAPLCLPNSETPEVPYPPSMQDWFELCKRYPYLAYCCGFPLHEPIPPRRMNKELFAALVGTIGDEEQGAILVEILLALLKPEIDRIVEQRIAEVQTCD